MSHEFGNAMQGLKAERFQAKKEAYKGFSGRRFNPSHNCGATETVAEQSAYPPRQSPRRLISHRNSRLAGSCALEHCSVSNRMIGGKRLNRPWEPPRMKGYGRAVRCARGLDKIAYNCFCDQSCIEFENVGGQTSDT